MEHGKSWKELSADSRTFLIWIISTLLDCAYLGLWVFFQWVVDRVVSKLTLAGIDQWVLVAFQLIFGLATLITVSIYLYTDIRIMVVRARRRIEFEELVAGLEETE